MFKLHGSPISNYYNMVKLALLEKGLAFDEVGRMPSQDEDFLAISPLGKIPVLEVKEGFLTETVAIVEFLEDVYPEIPLYPADPFARSEVRRLCQMSDLYIDGAFRPIFAARFMGVEPSEELKKSVRAQLTKGAKGIARVAKLAPFVAGTEFTAADIFLYYCLSLVAPMAKQQLDLDLYALMPGFTEWSVEVAQRGFVQQVDKANREAMEQLMKQRGQK